MPTTSNPLAVYQIGENIRECVTDALSNTSEGAPPRSCITTGAIAWDDCECGQLVVSIARTFFSSNFPAEGNVPPQTAGHRPCGPPIMVIEYVISMLRCAPTVGDDGTPPSCEALDNAARIAVEDGWAVRWGMFCCLKEWTRNSDSDLRIEDFLLQGQTFVGPMGICQGTETRVLVGVINSCPPCDQFEGS